MKDFEVGIRESNESRITTNKSRLPAAGWYLVLRTNFYFLLNSSNNFSFT